MNDNGKQKEPTNELQKQIDNYVEIYRQAVPFGLPPIGWLQRVWILQTHSEAMGNLTQIAIDLKLSTGKMNAKEQAKMVKAVDNACKELELKIKQAKQDATRRIVPASQVPPVDIGNLSRTKH